MGQAVPRLRGRCDRGPQVFETSDFPADVQKAADNPTVRAEIEKRKGARDDANQEEVMKYV